MAESLPARTCNSCDARIAKGEDRVYVDATWHPNKDTLCVTCWKSIMNAAQAGILKLLVLAE